MDQIREATTGDATALARIHVAGWRAAYQHIFPPEGFALRTVEAREVEFRDALDDPGPDDRFWVSERGGRVSGFAYTRAGLDQDISAGGELKLFYVDPALTGGGIGLPLFEHAVTDLLGRGMKPYLYTLRENRDARGWYERRGWAPDGVEAPWSTDGTYPDIVEVRYRPRPVA